MSNLNKNLKKDLKKVESLMRENLSKEPVVKDIYDYIMNYSIILVGWTEKLSYQNVVMYVFVLLKKALLNMYLLLVMA